MGGESERKVVSITEAKRYGSFEGDHWREQGAGAEVIPVDFRRKDLVQLIQNIPLVYAFVPDGEGDEGLALIITIPQWVESLITSVGLQGKKEMNPPDVV